MSFKQVSAAVLTAALTALAAPFAFAAHLSESRREMPSHVHAPELRAPGMVGVRG